MLLYMFLSVLACIGAAQAVQGIHSGALPAGQHFRYKDG